jgi:ribosomal protein S5
LNFSQPASQNEQFVGSAAGTSAVCAADSGQAREIDVLKSVISALKQRVGQQCWAKLRQTQYGVDLPNYKTWYS